MGVASDDGSVPTVRTGAHPQPPVRPRRASARGSWLRRVRALAPLRQEASGARRLRRSVSVLLRPNAARIAREGDGMLPADPARDACGARGRSPSAHSELAGNGRSDGSGAHPEPATAIGSGLNSVLVPRGEHAIRDVSAERPRRARGGPPQSTRRASRARTRCASSGRPRRPDDRGHARRHDGTRPPSAEPEVQPRRQERPLTGAERNSISPERAPRPAATRAPAGHGRTRAPLRRCRRSAPRERRRRCRRGCRRPRARRRSPPDAGAPSGS